MMISILQIISVVCVLVLGNTSVYGNSKAMHKEIRPYFLNQSYWQYKGKPTLLIGVSATDHLFLSDGYEVPNLKAHLDEIKELGVNYVRNTMSQREDWPLVAYVKTNTEKFDLKQFNEEYWERFSNFLQWTHDRDMIVQIELWDRFDFSRQNWAKSPWNPSNNINYSAIDSSFEKRYPQHPGKNLQPFFHGVPGHPNYDSANVLKKRKYNLIREYQEAFAEKVLSYTLNYGHVLYVMNNETSTHISWGRYWINYINERAASLGNEKVYCSDMFDGLWAPEKSDAFEQQLSDLHMYPFIDISQVNRRSQGNRVSEHIEDHWQRVTWIMDQVTSMLRPMNSIKVYNRGYFKNPNGPSIGISKMILNLMAGAAASRFHRSNDPNDLIPQAYKSSILALRMAESRVAFWDVKARMDLLSARSPGEAFLAANQGEKYLLYFPAGGSVSLNLEKYTGEEFLLEWISVDTASWGPKSTLDGGSHIMIEAPDSESWFAAIRHI